jgi:hypothetical protein
MSPENLMSRQYIRPLGIKSGKNSPRNRDGSASGAVEGTSRPPIVITANGPIEEAFVHQVTAKGGHVLVPTTKPEIHFLLSVVNAGLELLGEQIEEYEPLRTLGWNRSEATFVHKGPKHGLVLNHH